MTEKKGVKKKKINGMRFEVKYEWKEKSKGNEIWAKEGWKE